MGCLFLIQLSDLHFTSTTPRDSGRLLRNLTSTLKLVRGTWMTANDRYRVVVTGDLTDTGAAEEFALAQTFLRSKLMLGRRVPLDCIDISDEPLTNDELGIVPGNHDHWSARWWIFAPSQNREIRGPQFRKTVWSKIWRPAPTASFELQVLGVDTSSGMLPAGAPNFFQGGRIGDAEFTDLQHQIDTSPPLSNGVQKRVRAILIHHSLRYAGGRRDRTFRADLADVLDHVSRTRLLGFAVKNGIHAILSGHTHDSWTGALNPGNLCEPLVHELRSATTLKGSPGEQGFLLHRLNWEVQHRRVKWTVWKFRWTEQGFAPKVDNEIEGDDYSFFI